MIWTRSGGRDDGPLLVLLHGLGATAEVWRGVEAMLPAAWAGGWLLSDLPGHGRSAWRPPYTFEAHAEALDAVLPTDRDLVLLGHSMGGMVALALAAHRPRTRRVVAFSVKTYWPERHVEGMRALADKPPRFFADRAEAVDRHLRRAGLTDLVSVDDPAVDAGVVETEHGWRIAQDPRTNDFGVPDVAALLAAAACPVTLARGSGDPMVREENVRGLAAQPVTLAGLGHNPHVEDPAAVVALLR